MGSKVAFITGASRGIGKASAIGLVLMLLIMAVTALQFRLSRRFVFYQ